MPTVHREDGFRFFMWPNEEGHHLPHVHVQYGDGYASIALGASRVPPSLMEVDSMNRAAARKALRIAKEQQKKLLKRWKEIHG